MYKTLVVGIDGSPTAERAMARAIELTRMSGGRLHVITASGRGPARVAPGTGSAAPSTRPDFQADVALDAALARLGGGDIEVEQHVTTGDPAAEIIALAERTGADVIVLGSKGMRGAGRVLGSVPNTVSHRAPCDVLIVRTA
jgi:nucleotide-binding universal stress UspA family protein